MRKTHFISIFLVFNSFFSFAQNEIGIVPIDCSEENGFTMFLLDRAKPKILTQHTILKVEKYLENDKMIIHNNSELLKIEYTNIFGQVIDTIFPNATKLNQIKICVNKFKDYEKKSLIKESLKNKTNWVLKGTWGHDTFDYDELIIKSRNGFLIYKYYENGKRLKKGKIKITENIIEKISLFERKLYLMQNGRKSCNFGHSYLLINGIESIEFQDNSCSGFSNKQLLSELKII